ncbi:MAG: peptidase and chymotrypsin/Hap [Nocardioides sp.]|nr:peptidase and chymotrypsin/Hap [Nocardioides sp.]
MNDNPDAPTASEPESTPHDDTLPVYPMGPPPVGPPATPLSQPQPRPRGRTAFAASVVAASLLVGGASGVGGAAAWTSSHQDATTSSTVTSGASTSPVVNTPAAPTVPGSVEQVAKDVLPSVVKITVTGAQQAGSGSGIILSADGQILTNNHVVEIAGSSGTITVSFNDGSNAKAKVLGTDPLTDTAVIQAENVSGLTPATIGQSSNLQVGQAVVAIGSPFGLDSTVTSGIVSALDRPVDVGTDGQGNSTVYPAIQTDAAINPGNSGGPLVDMNGHVVGIDSAIQSTSSSTSQQSGSIGLGFAIPIDEVMPIIQQMINGQTPTHARLGITVSDVSTGSGAAVTEGAKVQNVSSGSTAQSAGIAVGDVITKVDDHLITGADSLVATIRSYRPNDRVTVTYEHGGQTKTADLTLDSDASSSTS